MSSSKLVDDSFYFVQSLIPKNHTQAIDFIKDHPSYDGRNVRIAIWDTGVDPASEGLQITTEGKPKLIHMSDTSGSGDVYMCTEVKPDCQNKIKLLSNREITIPESWNIGDQSLKIGVKSAADIFPAAVISRLSKDYKENIWSKEISRLQAELLNKKKKPNQHTSIFDLETQFLKECLEVIEKSYEYPIPVLDCIVFQKDDWVAWVDTTCLNPNMKLEDVPLLYSFHKQRQFTNFGGKTNLNFGVNIHDNGKLLEIVSCSGSHGTHVASIAAGYFPLRPECNGIAPGAEIVSIKISDNRLVSMETGMSLAFAAKLTVELKCDIVNLSFGESSMQPNCGRICQIMQELVSKHGIVFCSSSGNDGPALSTVGSPGGTTDLLFGISPLVFPDMVESNYSLPVDNISELTPQVYTWASRGPTTDGSLGIHVAAPGSAITSVAGWQNRTIGLMNGSSMSSPNACGGISLLISAAHQLNKPITPWLLALSTSNTASIIQCIGRLSQGNGLLQIKSAFDFIEKYWSNWDNQITEKRGYSLVFKESCLSLKENEVLSDKILSNDFNVSVKNESTPALTNVGSHLLTNFKTGQTPLHLFRIKCNLSNGNRGILLREPFEIAQKRHFTVNISPDFNEEIMEISDQVNIQLYLHLVCSASWVTCPRFFNLYNQERSISIQIDPTMLNRNLPEFELADSTESGDYGIYFTEIEFHCLEYSHLGPLARLPITVFKSESISSLEWHHTTKFTAKKKTVRHFIATPPGADSLIMTIKPLSIVDGSGRFELRIMQVQPNFSTVNSELSKSFFFEKKSNMTINESVAYMVTGHTSSNIEIAIAQYWSATNEAELEYSLDFHGLRISTEIVKMLSSDNHYRLLIESQLQMEEISPAITLNYLVVPLRPFKDELTYLQKSVSGDKELINLELFYTFNNPKAGSVGIFCPALGNLLYENDFYCQMYHIFDSNGRIVGSGDYKPEMACRRKNKYFFGIDKGDFKVQLNVRHGSIAQLERLRDQVIHVYFKTFQSLTFEFSKSIVDVNNNKKLTAARLNYSIGKGEKSVLYITTPMTKVLKTFAVGSYLSGTLYLYKNETLRKTVLYPFQYIFTAHQSATEKLESAQHFKLPPQFSECLMNYFRNEDVGRNSPVQSLPLEDVSVVSSTLTKEKLLQDHIEFLTEKPEFRDGLLKYLISWIKEFYKKSDRDSIEKLIKSINGEKCNTDFELAQLRLLQKNGLTELRPEDRWSKVDDIVNKLVTLWDTKDLSEYVGAKFSDASLSLTKDQKSKFDQNKQNLTEVLCIYGLCLCEIILDTEKDYSEDDKDNCSEIRDKLNGVYSQVCRFVSPWDNNATCLTFFVMHSFVFKCYGRMLKILLRSYEDQSNFHTATLIKEVLSKLEWNVLTQYFEQLIPLKHPISCRLQHRK